LFGDAICGHGGRILASVWDGNLNPIKELIEDSEVDEYVRGEGIRALTILALNDLVERKEIIEYYRWLLREGLADRHPNVMASVINHSCDLYPEELLEDIEAAYEQGLVDIGMIGMEDVDRTLMLDRETILDSSKENTHLSMIDDTIDELGGWWCFKDHRQVNKETSKVKFHNTQTILKEEKIGRNEPCPCGSGKKYKKCCGKSND